MAKTQDYTRMMQDMMASCPVDNSAMQDAFKTTAALGEKMARVALDAVEKSAEISNKWTKDSLVRAGEVTRAQAEPADYSKALTDFASASAEMAAENMAAFAEVAKKVQMETVELVLSAGKDMHEEASAAVKKTTNDVTAAARKTSAAAK